MTPYQAAYIAHDLTRLGTVGEVDRLSTTLFDSRVDLNPHQVEAALFAISNPLQKGVLLADEVGLGKTIEAGLVLCQKWAERRRKLIVVAPAHIRKQWQLELSEKFNLPAVVIDRRVYSALRREGHPNPFDCGKVVVISYGFAVRMKDDLRAIPFDLVVLDEAHKLRNAYQPSRKGGQAVRWAFELRQKILLTATPLQNSLLELYGLGWLIDDHVFGDKSAFQTRYCNAGGDVAGLRERLGQVCKRTLRKHCAYINYTQRHAMTHPFAQTDEEKTLHQDVMDFMAREISFAFPQRQRQLIEMILFKTLASSPQALASTLRTMRQRLIALRDGLPPGTDDDLLDALGEDDDLDVDALIEQIDGLADNADQLTAPVQGRLLAAELAQLDSLIARAEKITSDSKSKALLKALDAAFDRMASIGARRKALIFTESRKTQAFLAAYLEANGYAGKVVTFNGSNAHPSAKQAYDRFIARHDGTDKLTGSKTIDVRSALIEEFRDHADILLATEAAAEGVNLQFCSLVVNYDLPWNPQRIEQRIGRCHRYGQEHDVVVVNFLSHDNLADRRVQDLLQQKFSLFDGLFGASDEVLGAIEEGVDFEKRVLAILKTCRTDDEIEQAFNSLQRELESTISQKMNEVRRQLFEHFDADVHERLRMRGENARIALDRVGERFWKLAHWGLDGKAEFDDGRFGLHLPQPPAPHNPAGHYRLISTAKSEADYAATEAHLLRLSSPLGQWLLDTAKSQPLAPATVRFDISGHDRKISMLRPLVGQSGWLRLDKLTLDSDTREEFLLVTAVTDGGDNLDQEQAQRLLDVRGAVAGDTVLADTAAQRLAGDADRLASATLKVGESEPFAVVNVGDPAAVADACAANGVVRLEDDVARESLFKAIHTDDSPVNLLVGSRKFTEGWNSWRVSSIGLMHVGKGAGTQIIQLFGRGVRLRGYRMSLRRSSVLAEKPTPPKNLRQAETVQVFGVKATYMNTFQAWIRDEVPEAMEKELWDLPVVKTLPERKLKTLRLKEVIDGVKVERGQAFRQLGPLVMLRPPDPTAPQDAWLRNHPTRLNWLPRIRGLAGADRQITGTIGEAGDSPHQKFRPIHIALLDFDELLFDLEAFKATRGLDRLHADRDTIRKMFQADGWYELLATADDMRTDRYENRSQWQRMAQQLLNAYAERFYRFIRGRWEAPYIEVGDVDEREFEGRDYTIETTELVESVEEIEQIGEFVKNLKVALDTNLLAPWSQWGGRWRTVPFVGHLYQPLLYVGKNAQIKISPVPLDKHEALFVDDLAKWCRANEGREVYLLRNQAVTGLGFFQAANFFPDFLLWVQDGETQHLAFVDPKGLHHYDPADPKVQFATQEVPRLQQIIAKQSPELNLHAFILSNTPFASLGWSAGGPELMDKAAIEQLGVLFQADDPASYINSMMAAITDTSSPAQPASPA